MYTTTKATREQALKAAAAARRAMKRHTCCKSQFKFKCFSCGKMIHRGDKITRCVRADAGMTLRYRGAGGECGLTLAETAFYQAETGKDMWVHIGCYPCYWDKGYDNGDESSRPALCAIQTEWGRKIYSEFEDWTSGPGGESLLIMGVPYFLMVKGYPNEKFMRARIIRAVTRFQALWRGYIYKKAYPIARRQARATEAINETGRATLAAQNARKRNDFLSNNSIGAHVEVLFNENHPSATLYSGEVIKIQGLPEIDGLYFWVQYHHDHEVRRYHWKRLMCLKIECEAFKSKHGILAQIIGKLPLYNFIYP